MRLAIVGADYFRDDFWALMHPEFYSARSLPLKKMESYRESYEYLTEQIAWMEKQMKQISKEKKKG